MALTELDYYKVKGLISNNKSLFMSIALAVMTLAVAISYFAPKEYEAKSTVAVDKNIMSNIVQGIAVSPMWDDALKNLTYELTSRGLAAKSINQVNFNLKIASPAVRNSLIDRVQQRTAVAISGDNMLVVTFRYPDPLIARDYTNALVRTFIEDNLAAKQDDSFNAVNLLSEQLDVYKEKMGIAEDAVNQFKQENSSLVNLDPGWLMQQINASQQQLNENKRKLELLMAQETYFEHEFNPRKKELESLKKQLAQLQTDFSDNYPGIQDTKVKISNLESEIASSSDTSREAASNSNEALRVDAEIRALNETQAELSADIEKNQQLLSDLPTAKSTLHQLEAQVSTEKNVYDMLSLRRNQSELFKQMEFKDKTTSFRIIDPAVTPTSPVSPNRKKIIMLGTIAGILLALGLLILRDALNDSVTMVATLKSTNIPVLAVIPFIKSADEVRLENRRSLYVYISGIAYLALIGGIVAAEIMGSSFIDSWINRFPLSATITRLLGRFMH